MTLRFLLAFSLTLVGCVALPTAQLKVTAPEIRGRVIGGDSRQPVAGAKVSFEGREDVFVTTGADGRFTLPRQHDLVLMKVFTPCPVYDYPKPRRLPGAIVVQKAGWRTKSFELRSFYQQMPPVHGNQNRATSSWEDPTVEVGDVQLAL